MPAATKVISGRQLKNWEEAYLKALCYGDAYHTPVSLLQFACCHYLDADEYCALKLHLVTSGIATTPPQEVTQ